jgi:hypothetical protein
MDNEIELNVIRKLLSLHKKDSFSIHQICECLNHVSDKKKYQEEDVVIILNGFNNDKKINTNSYIGYDFFTFEVAKKENISARIDSDLTTPMNNLKSLYHFLNFMRLEYKDTFLRFSILFFLILIFPNYFLIPFLIYFIFIVNSIHSFKNYNLIIPLFIGIYPVIYGIFRYNEYIAQEFPFLVIDWVNLKMFDDRIDISYLNYLVVSLDIFLVSIIMFIKSSYDFNTENILKKLSTLLIWFQIILIIPVGYFWLAKYFTFYLFPVFYFTFFFLFITHFFVKIIDYSIIAIYWFYVFLGCIIFSSVNTIVEHYYESISVKNEDTCLNIDKNFSVIKNSKKIDFVVIDSKHFEFNDILRYIHFNNSNKIDDNYDFEIKASSIFSPSYRYSNIKKIYNELSSNDNNKKMFTKELVSDNYKTSAIIEYYIKSKTKNRFFYYKCD